MPAYAELWGLNPQTGRPYTVEERRSSMAAMGMPARPNMAGPLPSALMDNYFDRINYASTGLPDDFSGFAYGRPGSKQWNKIHGGLVDAAIDRKASGSGLGYRTEHIGMNPQSTFNTNQAGPSPWGQAKGNMPGIQAGMPSMTQQDPYEGVSTNKMINMSKGGAPAAALTGLKRYR